MAPYTAMGSRKNIQKNSLELFLHTLITHKIGFAIWGLCWYNSIVECVVHSAHHSIISSLASGVGELHRKADAGAESTQAGASFGMLWKLQRLDDDPANPNVI